MIGRVTSSRGLHRRCRVHLASPLRSYFDGASVVELEGPLSRVDDLLLAMDRASPGVRFRMVDERDRLRPFLKLVIGGRECAHLQDPLPEGAEFECHILAALSGG